MNETLVKIDRAEASLAMSEGRIPEAQRLLDGLIQGLGAPATSSLTYLLCNCLLDRAYLNDSAIRRREQLSDLDRAEELARRLPESLGRFILHEVSFRRGRLLAAKRSHDPKQARQDRLEAREEVETIRRLGVDPSAADALECDLALDVKDWNRVAELADASTRWFETRGWAQAAAVNRLNAAVARFHLGDLSRSETELNSTLGFFERWGPAEPLARADKLRAALLDAKGKTEAAWTAIN